MDLLSIIALSFLLKLKIYIVYQIKSFSLLITLFNDIAIDYQFSKL